MIDPIVIVSSNRLRTDVYTLARVTDEALRSIEVIDVKQVILRILDKQGEDPLEVIDEMVIEPVDSVVFDTLQLDELWQTPSAPDALGYNFRHVLLRPWETYALEWIAGHVIQLEYEFQREGKSSLWVVHDRELIRQVAD